MSNFAIHLSRTPLSGERGAGILRSWRALLEDSRASVRQEWSGGRAVAISAHHGTLPCTGLSARPPWFVAVAGSCWLHDADVRLATTQEVLERLTSCDLPTGPALRGQYALAHYDDSTGSFMAECAGVGLAPVYYCANAKGLTIATDLKFFPSLQAPALDEQGAAEYLALGYLVSDSTLLRGVRRLSPGSRLIAGRDRLEITTFPLTAFCRDTVPGDQLYDALAERFERGIKRHAAAGIRFSVSLSGGVDSRTALFAARRLGAPFSAWTAGEKGALECRIAQRVCRQIGAEIVVHENNPDRLPDWFERAVWLTEGRCPAGHLHFLDAAFAGTVPRLPQLHGLIGDVVAGGDYDTGLDVPAEAAQLARFCADRITSIVYWPSGSWERLGFHWIDAAETRRRSTVAVLDRCVGDDPYSSFLWSRYYSRGFGFIVPALASQVRPWADIVAPFLEPAFFELCATIDRRSILDRRAQFEWTTRRYPGFSTVPRVKDGVVLSLQEATPSAYESGISRLERRRKIRYYAARLSAGRLNVRSRESYPFYPHWYRRSLRLREFFEATLLSERSLSRGLWRRAGIERLLQDLRMGRNTWDAVGTILTLESFATQFIDRARPAQNVA